MDKGRRGGMFFATNSARVGRRTETWDSAARDDNVYSSTTEPSLSSSPSQQQPRMQERNEDAQDAAYKRYNEYFQSVGGSNNNMDYIPAARVNIHGGSNNDDPSTKRKIFITEQADELARFLRLDVNEIFQYKRRELDLHEDGTTTATAGMVNEDDVRDYLDKRYEQLFSMVSMMNDEDIEPFDSSTTRRRNSMYVQRDDDYRYRKSNEDANGWRQSSSRRRVPRRGHDSLHPPHPLSVPLSQLVSSPRRSERFREQQHVTQYPLEESHDGSHLFRQMQNQQQHNVVTNFQEPYQERSRSMDDIRRRGPDDRYSSQHSSRYYENDDEEYNSYFAPNTRNEPY